MYVCICISSYLSLHMLSHPWTIGVYRYRCPLVTLPSRGVIPIPSPLHRLPNPAPPFPPRALVQFIADHDFCLIEDDHPFLAYQGSLVAELAGALNVSKKFVKVSSIAPVLSTSRIGESSVKIKGSISGSAADLNGLSPAECVTWFQEDTRKPADESVLRNPSSTFLNPPNLNPQRFKWLKYLKATQETRGCTWHKADTWKGCNACCSLMNETLQVRGENQRRAFGGQRSRRMSTL